MTFSKKFPDFPKIWDEARAKSLADLKQHEEEYYEFVSKVIGTSVENVKILYPISAITDQLITDKTYEHLESVKEFLTEEGLSKKRL